LLIIDIKQGFKKEITLVDLSLNKIPDNVRHIHLIAVCGTAMGALAVMLKDMGYRVTGSDRNVYPPMSVFLKENGITVYDGFSEKHLEDFPDLVVVGNAVRKDNPESVKMVEMALPFCSMPQAVNAFAAAGKQTLLVTGTHGKTTTSSLLAWVLNQAGFDPSFMIGGILNNFNSNYRIGNGNVIVVEGDEYDTAFFDKGPKFLHYDPFISLLTGIEFDHADIYRDLDHIKQSFAKFINGLSQSSNLLTFDGDAHAVELTRKAPCKIALYGKKDDSDWKLDHIQVTPPNMTFNVFKKNVYFGEFLLPLPGEHNLINALSVIAAADCLGISAESIAYGLASFKGIKRRQEIRGSRRGVTVMDDFAHHPSAVRETIKAVRPFYPEGRLIAVFEPRTNTSMRDVFQDVYPHSFDEADIICIRKPPLLKKIEEGARFSSEKLVEDLKRQGKSAHYFPETDSIVEFLTKIAVKNDLILIMSNGGFDNIHERLLKKL
jgi:UDP-N-acetylmuramate: L-alanyl-gamma-D-glutamyl-meso-diaminopimelate ligase